MPSVRHLTALSLAALLLLAGSVEQASGQAKKTATQPARNGRDIAGDSELARLRADVIQKMKDSRAGAEKLVALREEEVNKLTAEYQQRRELYNQGLISRLEVNQSERALAEAVARAEGDKRWIAEQDIAITEASMRDELLRLPGLAVGAYSETGALIRFNGGGVWSIAEAPRIQKFFSQTFGRGLPVSAWGQTTTHDRLRFDHRDAIDVALHPDSHEGRSLINYLRHSGIPFIAFRNAVAGSATGAHIHIGKPSPSLRAFTAR